MDKMRATAALLAGVTLAALTVASPMPAARAQGGAPPAGLPRSQEEFEQQVGITAAQKAKIKAINDKYRPQAAAIDKKYGPKAQALQQQMMTLKAARDAELKPIMDKAQKEIESVFTPAQKAKMKQIQSAMVSAQQEQMRQLQGAGAMPGAPAKK